MNDGSGNGRGRPSKLTPELQDRIVALLRVGNYIETACISVGVSKTSLYSWLKRANAEIERVTSSGGKKKIRKSEQPYIEFLYAVEKAQAQAEVRDLYRLDKHAETNPNVLMWRLERRQPDRWGRQKIDADITHSGDISVNINVRSEKV